LEIADGKEEEKKGGAEGQEVMRQEIETIADPGCEKRWEFRLSMRRSRGGSSKNNGRGEISTTARTKKIPKKKIETGAKFN